jgi:hypothetical protein
MLTEQGIDAGQRSYAVFKDRWRWDDDLLNSINPDWFLKVKRSMMKKKESRKKGDRG